eukprot:2214103-Pyramimonas_sp.AAC.1
MQRLVGYSEAGLARQRIPPDAMQCWLGQAWAGHWTRGWYSLRKVERNGGGKINRSKRTGP